jgi:hypothetical protein
MLRTKKKTLIAMNWVYKINKTFARTGVGKKIKKPRKQKIIIEKTEPWKKTD